MSPDRPTVTVSGPTGNLSHLRFAIHWLIILLAGVLAIETVLRVRFPWDLYLWSESPFMTNMLKLHQHLPVYTNPADGNSFVYSPGLEYLTFALLHPFGLELDIRFCRLVSVLLGVMAAGFGALAINRLVRSTKPALGGRLFFVATWAVAWLVHSKNFLADVTHPDNLHAFHATLVFLLCLSAIETRRFSLAILTMLVAGFGVFAKQTNALAFAGPALAFLIFHPWSWRRWLALVAVGFVTLAIALWLLWLPHYGRFFTLDLPSRQGIWLSKAYTMISDLLSMDRALLTFLAPIAALAFWFAGGATRRYLVCWGCVGFFTVAPAAAAYLKSMGMWNNLVLFQIWFILIVWPFFGMLLDSLPAMKPVPASPPSAWHPRIIPAGVALLGILLVILLFPMKMPPRHGYFVYGRAIESAVQRDVQAGHKVLVSHGAEFLIHSGVSDVPLDRANTLLEMNFGGVGDMSTMRGRINSHYYDRIYLIMGSWYGPEIVDDIYRNYSLDTVISSPPYKPRLIYGYGELMEDCKILSPRQN